jgi:hypothetical protein
MEARRKAVSEWRAFLEATPPNIGVKIANLFGQYHPRSQGNVWFLHPPEIELFCETDGGSRKFAPKTDYLFPKKRTWEFICYTCKNCGSRWKMLSLQRFVFERQGEHPLKGREFAIDFRVARDSTLLRDLARRSIGLLDRLCFRTRTDGTVWRWTT